MVSNNDFNNKIRKIKSNDSFKEIGLGYSPAHITGIFGIYNTHTDPLKCGSRGIGFCIDKGVSTIVAVRNDIKQGTNVILNNQKVAGNTTKSTIENLVGRKKIGIDVFSYTDLPISQGFGLSGAGALSTAIALNSALDLDLKYSELVNAAHKAEILNNSGLGDVIAQATGGVVFRRVEGGIDFGVVEKLDVHPENNDIIVCVVGKELSTSKIITEQKYIDRINAGAMKHLNRLQMLIQTHKLSFEEIVKGSFEFAIEIGIMDRLVTDIINNIHGQSMGFASMIMLGNTVFAIGNIEKLKNIFKNVGQPISCKIELSKANEIR